NNQVYLPVPAGIPPGPASVALYPPDKTIVIPAVVMQVDAPDPVIASAVNAAGNAISQSNPVRIGDTITLLVTGLTQSFNSAGLANTQVSIGGISGGAVAAPLTITAGSQPD